MIKSYIKSLLDVANRGDAREESYYSTLEDLLNGYAESADKRKVHITTLPKKTEAGNPDFRIWDGKHHIVGYIEAKDPKVENLDHIESTEQLKRYLHTFPNLILTNFYEFRLYRNGTLIDRVQIGRPFIAHRLKMTPPVEKEPEFYGLLERFFAFSLPEVHDAKSLAIELAKRTRFLRDEVIAEQLVEEERKKSGYILGFYEAFKQYLIKDLSTKDFADLYSQTITYGLFAARSRSDNSFNRKLAYDYIPHTIGILRDIFHFVSIGDLPKEMEWIIDDIAEVLAVTNVNAILHKYFHEGKGKDPIVHFYETFLAEYDPATREKRGVYYTPEPVVSYIVRSLHHILKEHFNKPDGFASDKVTVLDPAAGTLTFLAEASKLAVEEFTAKYGSGKKEGFIKEHILKNFYAFELMMAPYAIGHLKMSFLLEELGCKLQDDDRVKLYLTNTLEMEDLPESQLPGTASLSEESHLAGKVKKEQPILVIMGNPPYSYDSSNIGKWIAQEIKFYYKVDGKSLNEKNPKGLQDDYVKFIRFAQWKIDQAGEGLLGFITNHGYLDNPTFRGMRQSLMNSFDEIYVLDLHGNSLKKEKCPDGSKDENVFDIKQGVAIMLCIKKKSGKKEHKVYHAEIWGTWENKYNWLLLNDIRTIEWDQLTPKSEFYLFYKRNVNFLTDYNQWLKITEVFVEYSTGMFTARDNLSIKLDRNEAWTTILNFSKLDRELARSAYKLGQDSTEWTVELAQKDLIESGLDQNKIVPILYRPFDIRHTYYTGKARGFHSRPRKKIMQHMFQENIGLITNRQVIGSFKHILCSNVIINDCTVSLETKERSYLFPLYLYPDSEKTTSNPKKRAFSSTMMLFEPEAGYEVRKPNFAPGFVEALTTHFKKTPDPETIFFYIYAVLYSNIYRTKYAEFLKIDFPRIPFTKDLGLFTKMAGHGKELVDLHLLKTPELDSPIAKFQGKGNDKVEKIGYDTKEGRVSINPSQYFEGVPDEVWQYQVGGYQVCEKWLKDRKGRTLSLDDTKHYSKIVTSLQKTIAIQKEIDLIYPAVEENTIKFEKGK
ncbi:MAG: N-6 DNA methylase [Syntrophorhabdaceae bacterium]|nr:N-6 DNA methylase [Syntrophorhabdaceae bacterium]